MGARWKRFTRRLRAPLHLRHAHARLAEFHARERSVEETIAWAMQLGTRGLYRVRMVQKQREIAALYRLVAELAPRNVLEIGTAQGGTLFLWSQLATRRVIGCDLVSHQVRARMYARFPPPGSSCSTQILCGNSHAQAFRADVARCFAGEPVDFLFIDGDHTAAGVEQDYLDYRALVRPGGLIAFHDVVEQQPLPTNQVWSFWSRLRREPGALEIVEDPAQIGFGIGVVRVAPTGPAAVGRGATADPPAALPIPNLLASGA